MQSCDHKDGDFCKKWQYAEGMGYSVLEIDTTVLEGPRNRKGGARVLEGARIGRKMGWGS